jgi:DNA-binding response OmpR family regulator
VTEPSQSAVPAPATGTDGSLSVPLDERAVLTGVEVALQAHSTRPDGYARKAGMLFFDGFTVDLGGHSLRDCRGSEVPLTRSEFALLAAFVRNPGRRARSVGLRATSAPTIAMFVRFRSPIRGRRKRLSRL